MEHRVILYLILAMDILTLVTAALPVEEATGNNPTGAVSVRLLYGQSQGVSWTDLAVPRRLDPILKKKYIDIVGLDYHYRKGLLFYSAFDGIWRLPIDSTGATGPLEKFVPDAEQATSIAVDWMRDRLYWIIPAEGTVHRIGLDGAGRDLVLTLPEGVRLGEFSNIVLDPQSRFLFLAIDGNSFIRTNTNGGSLAYVQPEGLRDKKVVSLAVETRVRRVYVSARHDNVPHIIACDYDGSHALEYDLYDAWWDKFLSIDVFGDQLFWVHSGWEDRDTVWKANMSSDGSLSWEKEYTAPETVLEYAPKIWIVRVYHPSIQNSNKNVDNLQMDKEESLKANKAPSTVIISSSVSKTKCSSYLIMLCTYLYYFIRIYVHE